MYYYIIDKDDPKKIRDANEDRNALVALLDWLPEYTEKDIRKTKDNLVLTPEDGWVKESDYVEPVEEQSSVQASNQIDLGMVTQSAEQLEELQKENQKLHSLVNELENDVRKLQGVKLEDVRTEYENLSVKDLKEYYVNKVSEVIKDACSEIIYEKYPLYKQVNIALSDDSDKNDFIRYRDHYTKQCDRFIENLKESKLTKKEMIERLDNLFTGLLTTTHHKQTILIDAGFTEYTYAKII